MIWAYQCAKCEWNRFSRLGENLVNIDLYLIFWLWKIWKNYVIFWRHFDVPSLTKRHNGWHTSERPWVEEQNGVSFMFLSSLQAKLLPKMWFWPLQWPWPWPLSLKSENVVFVIFCPVLMINTQYNAQWRLLILFSSYHHVTLAKYHRFLTPWTLPPTELGN